LRATSCGFKSRLRHQEPPLEIPIEADDVAHWIDAHDAAWRANDATAIGALFSQDGVYHLGPFEGPWRGVDGPFRGRAAIVAGWLAGADTSERFSATTEILAVVGRRAIVSREITYLSPDDRPVERYGCVWLLDFDGAGRCREYQEWFVPDERLAAEPG
jgi:SnoaL-like domain